MKKISNNNNQQQQMCVWKKTWNAFCDYQAPKQRIFKIKVKKIRVLWWSTTNGRNNDKKNEAKKSKSND
jgi:hypothetical protein